MEAMTFREHVRKRPGMYIGDVNDADGANHVVYELVANVLDQFLVGKATGCEVTLDGFNLTISDDGPGLPYGAKSDQGAASQAEYDLENAHFGPTARGHAPHVHLVTFGVGLAVINALCSEFRIVSHNSQNTWRHAYSRGIATGQPTRVADKRPGGTRLDL